MIFAGKRPHNLGITNGKLASCPNSPNCVSSQDTDPEHIISPLTFTTNLQSAMTELKQIIQSLPRTKIITETEDYLYAEFKSAFMGFVDDVEFYLDHQANVIQVRSASRLGYGDLGVNRQRIATIRAKFK
ncbi:DUF1499 domain-containing protein [Nodularia sp. UHCC 0506]|uniref:DUF1499 domain-containing protein n=1 Tax=Nodularia sp. UHCC 0506 TaxID=3110243 RepID=UPI002B21382D|nr:DUF1499 domain-containing protein [Nodularia sp. UHCC 0506]MEA5513521.1 DUF1499 domain-containing protein [Nodularia sp. UHCC 0506]